MDEMASRILYLGRGTVRNLTAADVEKLDTALDKVRAKALGGDQPG